jgi:glycine/D-amino acid oxidase-like deaminating enzyme
MGMSGVLIVGAGPAGLAAAVALSCHGLADDLRVVDPSGTWLAAWRRRFAAQDIPMLRSPAVHHPHPDPFALLEHADGQGFVASGGTQLPTTRTFDRFVDDLVEARGLTDRVEPLAAIDLQLTNGGRAAVRLSNGDVVRPDRIVLATNARSPVVPDALAPAVDAGRARTGDAPHVDRAPLGGRLAVIGAGLSAAHLALGAARRGAHVTLVARHRLRVRRFDTHPSWLGPRKRRPFEQEPDPHVRRRTIDTARGGGTIPARYRRALEACVENGRLNIRERVSVLGCEDAGDALDLALTSGDRLRVDEVWCATGARLDVAADPLCHPLLHRFPVVVADGLPDLAGDLTWPGTSVHLTGFAAALRLGPTAGNLIGHRRAALRLAAALRGDDPAAADRIATGTRACPVAGPKHAATDVR